MNALFYYCLYIKGIFKSIFSKLIFKYIIFENSGYVGTIVSITSPKYINIGKRVRIKDGCRIDCYDKFHNYTYNPQLILSDGVIIGYNFTALVADKILIGKDTIFASNVSLISENHGIDPLDKKPYHEQSLLTGEINIGEGCWIGQNVTILPNVSIGNKSIIAANSVVNKSVPPMTIAAGSPARVVKIYNLNTKCWEKVNYE